MTAPLTAGEKILAAMRNIRGQISAGDIAKTTGISTSNVASWLLHNAAAHNITITKTTPRQYRHDDPTTRTALQHALGYQPPRNPTGAQRHSERHPTGGSYGIHHSIGHSSAYSAMEAA